MGRKILIVELWGLGDLTFATPLISAALQQGEVWLVCKPHAEELLRPSFPGLRFITYHAPWTEYFGKYRFWKWDWIELFKLVWRLRREKFDVAVSVRNDPRNHCFMWLSGARERISFVLHGLRRFLDTDTMLLTKRLERPDPGQHKVEDWHQLGRELGLSAQAFKGPVLAHSQYRSPRVDTILAGVKKPILCLHSGARIAVRRWPEAYFERIVARLREKFDFHLVVIPEPDTVPSRLAQIADSFVTGLSLREVIDVIGRSDLLLCNDSAPGHLAACFQRPVIGIFGPSDPGWFRPWGEWHKVIIRDICAWRPCFDYCKFSEPHCMTKLTPAMVWPEIETHVFDLIEVGVLPRAFLRSDAIETGTAACIFESGSEMASLTA